MAVFTAGPTRHDAPAGEYGALVVMIDLDRLRELPAYIRIRRSQPGG